MAQRKTAGKRKTTGSKNSARAKIQQNKPRRREWAALVCAIMGFLGVLRYIPATDGLFIEALARLDTRLFGWGGSFVPVAFIICALLLWFHHGRPVWFRVFATAMIPVLIGGISHIVACPKQYEFGFQMIPQLWADATEISCGGAVSGSLAELSSLLISKFGTAVLFIVLMLLCVMGSLNASIGRLIDRYKNRERLEYEPDDTPERDLLQDSLDAIDRKRSERRRKKAEAEQAAREEAAVQEDLKNTETVAQDNQNTGNRLAAYDLPVDDPILPVREPKRMDPKKLFENRGAFFKKNPDVQTPDQVIGARSGKTGADDEEPVHNTLDAAETEQPPERELSQPHGGAAPETDDTSAGETAKQPDKDMTGDVGASGDRSQGDSDGTKNYRFPPITLLEANPSAYTGGERVVDDPYRERLEMALKSFGINSGISNIVRGPSVTRYEMELEVGVKLSKLTSLADDIALSLGASGVRIAAIPNKMSTVGIEVPNKHVTKVYLREIIESKKFAEAKSKLTFAIGKDISGEPIIGDIAKLPHMLVAGTTGSGKSVCLNSLILSILYKARPDEVKFIMVDPKMVEFKIYNGIPHLHTPVVTEAKKASGALQWAVTEMMRRYRLFSETGARELQSYNKIAENSDELEKKPQIVVVIDELADLMMVAAKEVEDSIVRIAQMGRAAGIHLVIATQSPRAEIITGLMKANIPSRIALKVSSALESRIILDAGGNADKLVGNGDMLYVPVGTTKPIRVQGTWVSDEEREQIVDFIKTSADGEIEYNEEAIKYMDEAAQDKPANGKPAHEQSKDEQYDELLTKAIEVILDSGQASVSMLQRRLKLGYARAARLVDQMEEKGIVGPFEGSKPRQILITKQQWQEMQFIQGTAPVKPEELPALTADDFLESSTSEDEEQ